MWFLKRKNKKEEKRESINTNSYLKDIIVQKALAENKEKDEKIEQLTKGITVALENAQNLRQSNDNLEKNMIVLQETISKIKAICKTSTKSKISKQILEELGE